MDNKLQLQDQLLDLLRRCTVKLTTSEGSSGTGFFVAPGLILTCAHVILEENRAQDAITVTASWNHQSGAASIEKTSTAKHSGLKMSYPDLALLRVNSFDGHPCVYLHEEVHFGDVVYSYGYIADLETGDPSSFESEDWTDENRLLLKLKGGLARPGLSGGPVLNLRTGGVCAILKRSRDINSPTGGRAIPTHKVFEIFPELKDWQQKFHLQDKRWYNNLTAGQREAAGLPIPTLQQSGPIEIFYSYSHKDERLRDELNTHLSLLRRQKLITGWFDREITGGTELREEIATHLNNAPIILLLVSPAFIASDYCYETEMLRAMERHEAKQARVIPIILRPCEWHQAPFGKLKALPKDGKPVVNWSNQDEALLDVAKGVRAVVDEMVKGKRSA